MQPKQWPIEGTLSYALLTAVKHAERAATFRSGGTIPWHIRLIRGRAYGFFLCSIVTRGAGKHRQRNEGEKCEEVLAHGQKVSAPCQRIKCYFSSFSTCDLWFCKITA